MKKILFEKAFNWLFAGPPKDEFWQLYSELEAMRRNAPKTWAQLVWEKPAVLRYQKLYRESRR